MGFSVGPEVEEDQTLRRLWFEGGSGIHNDAITPFRMKLITAYIDYRDFKIFPWKRGLESDEIPPFWKRVLRNFQRLEHDATEYKREKEQMKRKQWRGIGQHAPDQERRGRRPPPTRQQQQVRRTTRGVPPSADAAKDYMAYRKKAIQQHEEVRAAQHERAKQIQQQRRQQQQRKRRSLR